MKEMEAGPLSTSAAMGSAIFYCITSHVKISWRINKIIEF